MRSSLKDLARKAATPEAVPANDAAAEPTTTRSYRTAQTRSDTRQVSGHFKPDVAQTLRLIAVEQDKDVQEVLAEALNMLFERYGKATRADVTSGRRKKQTT
jgi:Antitoxin-like ribbon-helix-helix